MVAARLTNVAGSSAYFLGGVVCYSNDLKSAWTGVSPDVIEAKGAVSAEVAVALAEGIRRSTRASVGVSITGIAGPGGGTPEKPVGWFTSGSPTNVELKSERFNFLATASAFATCDDWGAGYGAPPFSVRGAWQRIGCAPVRCA